MRQVVAFTNLGDQYESSEVEDEGVDVGEVVVVVNLVLIVVDILSNIWLLFDCAVFCFQSFL